MFISVPICAIIYSALSEIVNDRIMNKDIYRKLREERRARRAARFAGTDVPGKHGEQNGKETGDTTQKQDAQAQPDNSVSPDNTTDGADDANPSEPAT